MRATLSTLALLLGVATAGWLIADGRTADAIPGGKLVVYAVAEGDFTMTETIRRSDAEWKGLLTPEQFRILRQKGTERAFSGAYWNNHEDGIYRCAGCGLDLFHSDTKFESGTGWPSFTAPVADENVQTREDRTFFMRRTEVLCARCSGHLGHVFKDGPAPTGLRYCLNSAALEFVAAGEASAQER